MIHFLPDPETVQPAASARLAGLDRALAVVERLGGEAVPARRFDLADAWANADDARRALADDWAERAASASAAGLEAVAALHAMGLEANPAALRRLADDIRDECEAIGAVLGL